jgi:hypothetical protein
MLRRYTERVSELAGGFEGLANLLCTLADLAGEAAHFHGKFGLLAEIDLLRGSLRYEHQHRSWALLRRFIHSNLRVAVVHAGPGKVFTVLLGSWSYLPVQQ